MMHSWRFYRQWDPFERITFVKSVTVVGHLSKCVELWGHKWSHLCRHANCVNFTKTKVKGRKVLTARFCTCASPTSPCSHHLHCGRLCCPPIIRLFLFDPHEHDQRHDWNRNQLCLDLYIQWIYTKWMWYVSLIVCTKYTHLITNYDCVIWELETKKYFYNNGTLLFVVKPCVQLLAVAVAPPPISSSRLLKPHHANTPGAFISSTKGRLSWGCIHKCTMKQTVLHWKHLFWGQIQLVPTRFNLVASFRFLMNVPLVGSRGDEN